MKGFEDVPDGSWFGSFKVDNDEEFGMVGDTDYKIYKFDRSNPEHSEFMDVELGLPEEIDGTEGL